ncbi:MAG: hypothetical protein C0473_02395 [Cyanobacteria bacterium DS3.002]|nr:hypothetical protein [Cyanobacteria bacterium DS3.002]MBA4049663.1 hypothetical protein [Cyanobacteria bacterium DS2.008]MBA4076220.1 hypothetical protein [Cyanobacteria bacterium PR.023]
MSNSEFRDLVVSAVWYFYRVKVDYRTVATQYFSDLVKHPTTSHYSARNVVNARVATSQALLVNDNSHNDSVSERPNEDGRYQPPNFKRYALEIEYFRKVLALCKEQHIEGFVVNMPMTVWYRGKLDKRLDQQYLLDTQNACKRFGAKYLNFNDSEFVESDFKDGFHTNVVGSEKVLKRLVIGLAHFYM